MVDGVLLLIDAWKAPCRRRALSCKRPWPWACPPSWSSTRSTGPDARPQDVLNATYDLFIDLDADEPQLEFPVLYVNAREGLASTDSRSARHRPGAALRGHPQPHSRPGGPDGRAPLQMLVASLAYDDYKGKIAIGRLVRGSIHPAQTVARISHDGVRHPRQGRRGLHPHGPEPRGHGRRPPPATSWPSPAWTPSTSARPSPMPRTPRPCPSSRWRSPR